ncbi:Flp family type IVb pilin [Desulfoluna butyratoxydans]|uniref:Pilus assembly protein Flp/PilA n=3 Tax=Desulfoluna TaxID=497721 RepID=A0A1G5HDT0_9BACT|nr:Flp family type IVb pilin [Desulfoluna butyratoxydans]SCY61926.1 pilus assembly protein Flp/PilA [Desulfoluna spongiiphila]VFQ46166.1 flp/fap pilin component [Desulfoluna butyratoxydans]VVS94655.1 flp/fap pilin component [Desulfoluna spongiiphila]
MIKLMSTLWNDESGATAIEYGLIVGVMAAVLVGALNLFGTQLTELFTAISDKLGNAAQTVATSDESSGTY